MALLGGLAEPRHRRSLVAGEPVATEVHVSKPDLGIGIALLGQRLRHAGEPQRRHGEADGLAVGAQAPTSSPG